MEDEITLEDRDITPPEFGSTDFSETFTTSSTVWALIETVDGKTFFDGVSTEDNVTHWVYINYDATVTAETWITLSDSRRLDILRVEDLDERNDFMLLHCTDRGATTASQA
jgi:SPP1 family predicted phage head-tail adaptor